MRKVEGKVGRSIRLLTVLALVCVVLSAFPVHAGIPYCWFNKSISTDDGDTWLSQPTLEHDPVILSAMVGEDVYWIMLITIEVPSWWPGPIEDVVVRDRFGAEWEIVSPFNTTHGTVLTYTRGRSEKVFLVWEIGTLSPGEDAFLAFIISTDLNPAGKQEYTSPGCYELNSGAVLKFRFGGEQYSVQTLPMYVTVSE